MTFIWPSKQQSVSDSFSFSVSRFGELIQKTVGGDFHEG